MSRGIIKQLGVKRALPFVIIVFALLMIPQIVDASFCVQSAVRILPDGHDFGSVDLGSNSATNFTVRYARLYSSAGGQCTCNCGQPTTVVVEVSSNDPRFQISPNTFSLADGAEQNIQVTFTPTAEANYGGTLTAFVTNASVDWPVSPDTATVTGVGYQPQPRIYLDQTSLDIPATEVGQSGALPLVVENQGDALLNVNLAINAPFAAIPSQIWLQPGDSQTVAVSLAPTTAGPYISVLTAVSNDPNAPNVQLLLSGAGIAPDLNILSGDIDFGNIPVGQQGSMSFQITNQVREVGNNDYSAPLVITDIQSTSDKVQISPTQLTLAPGDSATLNVQFEPTNMSLTQSTLTFISNHPETSPTLQVSGQGVQSDIELTPTQLNFGQQLLGTSAQQTITVSNNGNWPLEVTDIINNSSSYVITPTTLTLGAGASTDLTVTFDPSATGEHSEQLIFESNDPSAPSLPISLLGEGINPQLVTTPPIFGPVYQGSQKQEIMTLENQGSAPLVLSQITSNHPRFQVDQTSLTLLPGESGDITITFSPVLNGFQQTVLSFQSNEHGNNQPTFSIGGSGVPSLDLIAGPLEITQTVQTSTNDVPLILGKPTLVRAKVTATIREQNSFGETIRGVDGKLHVLQAGIPVADSPFQSSNGPILVNQAFVRSRLDDTLNFQLPPSLAIGEESTQLTFQLELNPDDNGRALEENNFANNNVLTTVWFHKRWKPIIDFVPISYRRRGLPHEDGIANGLRIFKSIFPVGDVEIRRRPPIQFNLDLNQHGNRITLFSVLFFAAHLGNDMPADRIYGWLPAFSMDNWCGWGEIGGRVAFGESHPYRCETTFAHEIGHTYGLCHTHEPDTCLDGHTMDQVNIDEHGIALPDLSFKTAGIYKDFMSYSWPKWIHTQRYQTLFDRLVDRDSDPAWQREVSDFGINRIWLIAGEIAADGSAAFHPLYETDGTAQTTPPPTGSSQHRLRARDASGAVLWETDLPIVAGETVPGRPADEDTSQFFRTRVPVDATLNQLEITTDDGVIATLSRSAHPPTIQVTQVERMGPDNRLLHLQWNANDLDGDPLLFSIQMGTAEQGERTMLAVDLTQTEFFYDTSHLPGTDNAWFTIQATDGIHNTTALAGPIPIENKPPQVTITSPQPSETFLKETIIHLEADATDQEEGTLPDAAITWYSDLDGLIGVGRTVRWQTVTEGRHQIQVVVNDQEGMQADASITIDIENNEAAPRVVIAAPRQVPEEATFQLDGTDSYHPTSTEPLSFEWRQLSGPVILQSPTDQAQFSLAAPTVTTEEALTFQLTVTDHQGHTAQAVTTVIVTNDYAPQLEILHDTLNFGIVAEGSSTTAQITVRNSGDTPLHFQEWTLSHSAFSIVQAPTELAPNESADVTLSFQPEHPGLYQSLLDIITDSRPGYPSTVTLIGGDPSAGTAIDDTGVGASMVPAQLVTLIETNFKKAAAIDDPIIAREKSISSDLQGGNDINQDEALFFGGAGCSLIRQ